MLSWAAKRLDLGLVPYSSYFGWMLMVAGDKGISLVGCGGVAIS
jgi:hypothetical protein